MSQDHFNKLLQCILAAHEDDQMSCEVCTEQFDCLAEQVAAGADMHVLLPAVEKHLSCCPDCREEFEALVSIIRAEDEDFTITSENK